jgi:hypothetical protein
VDRVRGAGRKRMDLKALASGRSPGGRGELERCVQYRMRRLSKAAGIAASSLHSSDKLQWAADMSGVF